MPQVRFSAAAIRDLERLRQFLREKNPAAAKRAAMAIIKATDELHQFVQRGRPIEGMDEQYRELIIDFGRSGYVASYRVGVDGDVTILTIRHQREASRGIPDDLK
jgi:plasmid stabilization system protein ParE